MGSLLQAAARYRTGAVVFWSEGLPRYIVLPPFAVPEDRVFQGSPETSRLRQLLETEHTVGVLLVTWGSYAMGVFRGNEPAGLKSGTGYVHKRHKKGGRSQKRFARRTEEQKVNFLRRVARYVDEVFRGHLLEQVFFGGNRLVLRPLIHECPYLQSREGLISKRFLNVRYADSAALARCVEEIDRSAVFRFDPFSDVEVHL
jgi:hypothetical protein